LTSRVWIEQAKGVLAATQGTDPEAAFQQLRIKARSSSRRLAELAQEVIQDAQRQRLAALAWMTPGSRRPRPAPRPPSRPWRPPRPAWPAARRPWTRPRTLRRNATAWPTSATMPRMSATMPRMSASGPLMTVTASPTDATGRPSTRTDLDVLKPTQGQSALPQQAPDGEGPGAEIGLGAAGTLHRAAFGRCPHPAGGPPGPKTPGVKLVRPRRRRRRPGTARGADWRPAGAPA